MSGSGSHVRLRLVHTLSRTLKIGSEGSIGFHAHGTYTFRRVVVNNNKLQKIKVSLKVKNLRGGFAHVSMLK